MSEGKCPFDHTETANEEEEECPHLAAMKKTEQKEGKGAEEERCPFDKFENEKEHAAQKDWSKATPKEFKEHFTQAYDDLAAYSLNREGCEEVARVLMGRLGYTQEELDVIGPDVWLMQGTGNPHMHAKLQPGEVVVDLGSGFGIDACIMAAKVRERGRVIGIDLSLKEITAALQRVSKRQLTNCDFRYGDIECPPIASASADCVMSNGGFCLVPDKDKSFAEIFRMLKPGGRMSICCTTRLKPLDPAKAWPACMTIFMPFETITPVLTKCGFVDIFVDDTHSRVDVWDEIKLEMGHKPEHDVDMQIHTGNPKYAHLQNISMNEYFALVTIVARKPAQ